MRNTYLLLSLLILLVTRLTLSPKSEAADIYANTDNVITPTDEEEAYLGEIAISLDDAPMPGTRLFGGMQKTEKILQALAETNCPPIGIFATAMYATTPKNLARLRMYGEAGNIIANHSYHHYNLNQVSAAQFIADIEKAHAVLHTLPNFRPFFRFPYLAEGKNKAQRQQVIDALHQLGYQEGYTTVNNHDYYLNKLLLQAVKAGKVIDYDKLRKLYLTIIWDCIATNQKLAYSVCNRKVKHVLLLHENDVTALFLKDLIEHIRAQGWKIISIEEAYQDEIATIPVTNTYSLVGRISAIAVEKGLGKKRISFPATAYLDYIPKAVKEQGIFT